ncbi:MAG: hypothetical protein M5U34_03925 [Chloroflexi bacterium]|nr:hypothetical protein [Chloroflexota bacterium]
MARDRQYFYGVAAGQCADHAVLAANGQWPHPKRPVIYWRSTSLILIFALIAKILPAGASYMPLLVPMAALSMLVAVIFDVNLAVLVTVVMAGLLGFTITTASLK